MIPKYAGWLLVGVLALNITTLQVASAEPGALHTFIQVYAGFSPAGSGTGYDKNQGAAGNIRLNNGVPKSVQADGSLWPTAGPEPAGQRWCLPGKLNLVISITCAGSRRVFS